ncbi:hypothetical protein ABZU78_29355 [Rhodococcus erythropolis]|uniref:hypothetical protein n=1 Tax=Rhodococcus erythropolis TaxID=1833 RepID=UPI0033ABD3D1
MTVQNAADKVNAHASGSAKKLDHTSTVTQIVREAERRDVKPSTILAELESILAELESGVIA